MGQSCYHCRFITVGSGGSSTALAANDDVAEVQKGQTVTIDVIANDAGTDIVLAEIDPVPANIGTASIVNNKLVFTAGTNYSGEMELWYGISDASGNDEWAKVTITIH